LMLCELTGITFYMNLKLKKLLRIRSFRKLTPNNVF
jgi:hypothetical protein